MDKHKERESNATAFLEDVFTKQKDNDGEEIVMTVDENVLCKRRVLSIRNCHGPGTIFLPSILSSLSAGVPVEPPQSLSIQGLIKIFISDCHDCTIKLECKVITSMIEISKCSNVHIIIGEERISTIQADLCEGLKITFMDEKYFGGKDDKIYHAGVSDMKVCFMEGQKVSKEKTMDYVRDGAVQILDATAEEYQFVTSNINGELLTERLYRLKNKSVTEREMTESERKKYVIDGNSTGDRGISESTLTTDQMDDILAECAKFKQDGNDAFVEGEYAQAVLHYSMCIEKSDGLDIAAESCSNESNLPSPSFLKTFKEKHIVFANRSACFLKLGHHDKALADADKCIEIDPSYVKGLFRRGVALHAMKNYKDALETLSKAHKIEPKNKQIKQALQMADVRFSQIMRKRFEG